MHAAVETLSFRVEVHALPCVVLGSGRVDQVCPSHGIPQFLIRLFSKGIEVAADGATKQQRLLRKDG